MKKVLILLLFLSFIFVGCSLDDILSPSGNGGSTGTESTVTISEKEINLKEGETKTLTAEASDGLIISWKSENSEVASVTDGVVTAKKEGKTNIVAYTKNAEAKCLVIVSLKDADSGSDDEGNTPEGEGGSQGGNTGGNTQEGEGGSQGGNTGGNTQEGEGGSQGGNTGGNTGDIEVEYQALDYNVNYDLYWGEKDPMTKEMILGEFSREEVSHYSDAYENKLPEPSHDLTSAKDLVYVLDYMAFYHVEEFSVNATYQNANLSQDVVDAFWETYFCPGTVGVEYKGGKVMMYFNENANQYYGENYYNRLNSVVPYQYLSETGARDENFNNYAYLTKNSGSIDVYNSDQLIYVLEHGYLPNIIENSPAETIYNKACQILNSIINDNMNNKEKATAIYSYLVSHVKYDNDADDYASAISEALPQYPDYIASNMRAFYADGALLHNVAVCHGYAKAFSLLALIEGIELTKVSSPYRETMVDGKLQLSCITYTINASGKYSVFSSHGYVYVLDEGDNKYYICDPTYAHFGYPSLRAFNPDLSDYQGTVYRSFAIYKAYQDWSSVYEDVAQDWFNKEHADELGLVSYNWLNDFKMSVNNIVIDCYFETREDVDIFVGNICDYLNNYNDPAYLNEGVNIFGIQVDAADNIVQYATDVINLWGWESYYRWSDVNLFYIYQKK